VTRRRSVFTYGRSMIKHSSLWGKGGGRLAVLMVVAALLAVAFGASWNDALSFLP
jgi:hypothetical protein